MFEIQKATLSARKKTGLHIGVSVKSGKFTVVEIKKKKNGSCDVLALSCSGDLNSAIRFLNSL